MKRAVALAVWLARRARIEVTAAAIDVGYWLRPYDMIRDARRWRWQPRGRCGQQVWADAPQWVRDEITQAIERQRGGAK